MTPEEPSALAPVALGDPPKPPRAYPPTAVTCGVLALGAVAILAALGAFAIVRFTTPAPAPATATDTVAPTPTLLVAMRELSRLEALDLHFEKVIDLSEKQERLWGLVEATDAILLVSAVDVTMGVDLAKLGEGDVVQDPAGGPTRICLPEPEILSSRLDEAHTHVYRRTTGMLAKRNEALEAKARKAAVDDVEKAVKEGDAGAKARAQVERTVRTLANQLGAHDVEFVCP